MESIQWRYDIAYFTRDGMMLIGNIIVLMVICILICTQKLPKIIFVPILFSVRKKVLISVLVHENITFHDRRRQSFVGNTRKK